MFKSEKNTHYLDLTLEEKKKNGVYYTPHFLASYVAEKMTDIDNPNKSNVQKILDPACGDGILLEALTNSLKGHMHICGVDIDIQAVSKCKNRLSNEKEIYIINDDALFPKSFSNQLGWDSLRNIFNVDKFDYIISNPPWGANLNGYSKNLLKSSFRLAIGQFDSYNLFIETILNNLRNDGIFGLIIPDSLFSQEQWRLRKILATNTELSLIARLGEKIFDEINRACTVVVGKKCSPSPNHFVKCFRLNPTQRENILKNGMSLSQVERKLAHDIKQARFLSNDDYIFNIDLKKEEINTIDKIKKGDYTFSDFTKSSRGVELSKKGWVCRCEKCKKWFPKPRSKNICCSHCGQKVIGKELMIEKIVGLEKKANTVQFLVGEDLDRYTSKYRKWIDISKKGINYKEKEKYHGTKILVRKTGVGITSSIDYSNAYTNQVVYILKVKDEWVDIITPELVIAILNSRVVTYYLLKTYGENEWRSHPYITQKTIANLPFPNINIKNKEHLKLIKELTLLIKQVLKRKKTKMISSEIDAKIEKHIARLFKLTKSDYKAIFNELKNSQPLIPIKRLLNVSLKDIFN